MAGAEPWSVRRRCPTACSSSTASPATPSPCCPLAEALAAAGFTVELPLLPGHGTAVEDMLPTRWEDWSGAAEAALPGPGLGGATRVVVAGLSMGGTLTCWLAEHHPEIAGIALVNPLIQAPDAEFRAGVRALVDAGTEVFDAIGSDIAKEGAVEAAYPGTPLAAVLSLFEGVDGVQAGLDSIRCPALLFSSRDDHVVEPVSGDVLEHSVSGPIERVFLDRSYHVATLDWDAPLIEAQTVAFVDKVLGGSAPAGA